MHLYSTETFETCFRHYDSTLTKKKNNSVFKTRVDDYWERQRAIDVNGVIQCFRQRKRPVYESRNRLVVPRPTVIFDGAKRNNEHPFSSESVNKRTHTRVKTK